MGEGTEVERLREEVAQLADRNEYLEERQVALETQNAELRKKVTELEDSLLDVAVREHSAPPSPMPQAELDEDDDDEALVPPSGLLSVNTSNLGIDVDVELDAELFQREPTPLRPAQRPRSPAPMASFEDPDDVADNVHVSLGRPTTSRGVPQPSPEAFSDYVVESPEGEGTRTSGVVCIDTLRSAVEKGVDEETALRVELLSPSKDTLERPKTSRRVPQPSPQDFSDYVVECDEEEGAPATRTVTIEELRAGQCDEDERFWSTAGDSRGASSTRARSAPPQSSGTQELPVSLLEDLNRLGALGLRSQMRRDGCGR